MDSENQELLFWWEKLFQKEEHGIRAWTQKTKSCCGDNELGWRVFFFFFNFTILYWFCHISTWIHHRYTRVPRPEPSFLLPPHTIPLGRPSAPAPSIQYRASNLDWWLISCMILYMFQCHSPKSSHPLPFPQSPQDWSIHQCLFCCLIYRLIVTIFLNSIYMAGESYMNRNKAPLNWKYRCILWCWRLWIIFVFQSVGKDFELGLCLKQSCYLGKI